MLAPVSKIIEQVASFCEQRRGSPLFNHLSSVKESVPAFGWVAMVRKEGCIIVATETVLVFVLCLSSNSVSFLRFSPSLLHSFWKTCCVTVSPFLSGSKAGPFCEGHAGSCHVLHQSCSQGLQGKVSTAKTLVVCFLSFLYICSLSLSHI